ncbi:MAG: GNAT family N-acetyltransferase [Candidatus Kariarchaeaceae archaeon]
MAYKIEETDFSTLSEEQWISYFEHYERMHLEDFPDYPLPSKDLRKQKIIDDHPNFDIYRWLIYLGLKVIGYGFMDVTNPSSPNYETNKHLAEVYISIDKEYRRRGIGTKMYQIILEEIKKIGRDTIQIWTNNIDAKATCTHLGADLVHTHYVNKLLFHNINWDLMQEWISSGKRKAQSVTLEMFNDVPEKDIVEFVDLYTETINQAPWDAEGEEKISPESRRKLEKRHREMGDIWKTMISREENGSISGMTEIIYNPKEPDKIQQELTGVREKYRGRGIGKWLKAEMALFIKKNYPNTEYISTGNATKNAPMLSINREMGFKLITSFHSYQIKI